MILTISLYIYLYFSEDFAYQYFQAQNLQDAEILK
jgi:hypothetical protein